ncbi:MAG: tetratricopeptide repeat protein [SAR324 cluster bacterium]|nr:tetratricopeptide repeat protein [SAR324 cluster bacterium]
MPFKIIYPAKRLDWAGIFLQEELTHQLVLSRKFSLRSAEAMQLWSQKQNLTEKNLDLKQMNRLGVQNLILVEMQKVIEHASFDGVILSVDHRQVINRTRFRRISSWKSPDKVILDLVNELAKSTPVLSDFIPFPQHYQWESLEAFYQWKLLPDKAKGSEEWLEYKEDLEILLSHYPDIARLIYPELAAMLLLEGTQPNINNALLNKAETAIREALRLDPKNDLNHVLLAQIFYYKNEKHSAKSESVIAYAHNPQNAMARILYGLTIGQTIQDGEKYILEGLNSNPFLVGFPSFAGRNLTSYKTFYPILSSWTDTKNTVLKPNEYEESMSEGQKQFEQKDWEKAKNSFERAAAKDTAKIDPVLYLVRISINQKKFDEALKSLSDLKSQFPESSQAFLYTGIVHEHLKSYEQAEINYRQALFIKSDHPQTLLRLGTVLIKSQRYDQAENYLQTLVRKYPKFSTGWWNLGLLYWSQKNWQKAKETLKEALRLDPNNPKIQDLFKKVEENIKQ